LINSSFFNSDLQKPNVDGALLFAVEFPKKNPQAQPLEDLPSPQT
jgi:hypothetical protein